MGRRPSSAVSDSSTYDAKPALIGPSAGAHGKGLFDVDPISGKSARKIRPAPSSKPVIVFAPEAE